MAQMSPSGSDNMVVATSPQDGPEGGLQDWLVVATSTLCIAVSVIHYATLGVFLLPIERELGWTRTEITAGLTVVSVVSVVCAPFVGALIDRVGSRYVAIPGIIIYCASIAALGSVGKSVATWWALWLAVASGSIFIKITVWMATIAKRFNRRRGLAFAVALSGTGIGAAILPNIATVLIGTVGWRHAYVLMGAIGLVVALPLLLIFFRDARPVYLKSTRSALPGMNVRESLFSGAFQRLAITSLIATASIVALAVHFVPIMVSHGISPASAAGIASVVGIFSVIGRLLTGVLLDRFHGPLVGAISLGLPLVACFMLFGFDGDTSSAVIIAAVIGFSVGAEIDVVAFLTVRYFGLRNYGVLFGTLAGLLSLGGGVGPLVASWVFDRFGSYQPLIWIQIPAFVTSVILIGTLGRYPSFTPTVSETDD
jgi:MFS family permease